MTSDDTQLPIPPGPDVTPVAGRVRVLIVGYGIALLLAGVVDDQLLAAVAVLVTWVYIFCERLRTYMTVAAALLFVWLFLTSLLPTLHSRNGDWRRTCRFNLKQIGLALHNYHDEYDSFPPGMTYDGDGRPMHSWRVLLLPYMEHRPLYEEYDLSQPWDSPHNQRLTDRMPDVYRCPSRELRDEYRHMTSYVAVVGEQAFWPPEGTRSVRQVDDGLSNTVAIVECDALETPWLQPVDLSLDEAIRLLTIEDPRQANGHHDEDRYYVYHRGRNVMLGDGAVRFIPWNAPADAWRAALAINDGGTADEIEVPVDYDHPNRVPKVGNWVQWWTFVALCLLPLPWVFRRQQTESRSEI